jgi:hypothetical protein
MTGPAINRSADRSAALPVLVMAVAACGRIGFGPVTDAEPPAGDAAPWEGAFTLEPPVAIAELNTPFREAECFLFDDTNLWFTSDRPGGTGSLDIYQATRPAPGAPFESVIELSALNSAAQDTRLISADGLVGYFHSMRPGGLGSSDVWMVTRGSAVDSFDGDDAMVVAGINTAGPEYDSWVSSAGLRLYYVIVGLPGGPGGQDLVMVERSGLDQPFGPPAPLAVVNSAADDDNPFLSADERFLVFSSGRPGSEGTRDIYYARRPDRGATFSEPQRMPVVNGPEFDWEPCFSVTGELVFSSGPVFQGSPTQDDFYRSRFVPL